MVCTVIILGMNSYVIVMNVVHVLDEYSANISLGHLMCGII